MKNHLQFPATPAHWGLSQQGRFWLHLSGVAFLLAALALGTTSPAPAYAGPFGGDKWEYLTIICTEANTGNGAQVSFDFTSPQEEGQELTIKDVAQKLKLTIRRKGAENAPNTTDVLNGLGAAGWELANYSESRWTTTAGVYVGTVGPSGGGGGGGGGTTGIFAKYRWILKRKA